MGGATWDIRTQMAYGIIVAIKDVRAAFAESSEAVSMAGTEPASESSEITSSDEPPAPLEDEIKLWMLQQADKGFKIVDVYGVFVLVMHQNDDFFDHGHLNLSGPDEIELEEHGFYIHVLPGGIRNLDVDNNLVRIASALTPTGRRLRYPPGPCLLCCTYNLYIDTGAKIITHPEHKLPGEELQLSWVQSQQQENSVPSDLTIVVDSANKERVYSFNRAALAFYLPELVRLMDARGSAATLNLPDIDFDTFEYVVDYFAAFGSPPTFLYTDSDIKFLKMLGVSDDEEKSSEKKKACSEMEGLEDLKSKHNVTFLVGPDETPVTAQREVIAAANPVLCRILYGLDRLNPTVSGSIKWPDFDAFAVERVLEALVYRKVPTYAPYHCRRLVLAVLDYLGEVESSVSMGYDELPRLEIDDSGYRTWSRTVGLGFDSDYFVESP